jgi:hypothetical protein
MPLIMLLPLATISQENMPWNALLSHCELLNQARAIKSLDSVWPLAITQCQHRDPRRYLITTAVHVMNEQQPDYIKLLKLMPDYACVLCCSVRLPFKPAKLAK